MQVVPNISSLAPFLTASKLSTLRVLFWKIINFLPLSFVCNIINYRCEMDILMIQGKTDFP